MKYTTDVHNDFANHDEIRRHIEDRESNEGGAFAYDAVFGTVWIYRADNRASLPDFLTDRNSGRENPVRWRGKWTTFTEAQIIREQNRGYNADR